MSNFLIVTITKWKQTSNNQIEYYFNLHSELTNKNWEIVHTLEEYDKYHQYLLITFSNLPLFPDLHFAYLNLQKTKILLEMYTAEILQRNDILSNPQTEVFFDLKKNHFCDFYQYQPTVILTELKSTKIIRAKELDIFISAYKNELSLLDIDLENEKSFVVLYKMKVQYEISLVKYKISLGRFFLLLGLENGIIELYRIVDKNKVAKNLFGDKTKNFSIEKMNEVKPHKSKVLYFDFDLSTGYIYSSSQSGYAINVSEINYEKTIATMSCYNNSPITAFAINNEQHLAYVTDNSNSLYVYNISDIHSMTMLQGYHNAEHPVSFFKLKEDSNLVLIGTTSSFAACYHYNNETNTIDKIAYVLCDKSQRFKVISLCMRKGNKEMIVSLSNGKIQFWSIDEKNPIFVIDCCGDHKYDICYYEEKNVLISNCDEECVKIYKLPQYFMGEVIYMKYNKVDSIQSIFDLKPKEEKTTKQNDKEINEQCEENYDSSLDGWDDEKEIDIVNKMLDLNINVPI